jgi:hypothetical protein
MHDPPEDLLDWGSCRFLSSFRQNATLPSLVQKLWSFGAVVVA